MPMLDLFEGNYKIESLNFHFYRTALAKAAGLIKSTESFYDKDSPIDWKKVGTFTDFGGYWSEIPNDPIWYFLAHADDTGYIELEHLKAVVKRLKELGPKLSGKEIYPNWQQVNKKFITNLNKIIKDEKELIFNWYSG